MVTFARRCAKEILRDPVNCVFGLGFPLVLLLLLSAIQANIPVSLFGIESLAPGIAVFALSFLPLFAATLVAKDRESALLQRLYASPMKPADFILGYLLPIIPVALAQSAVCFGAALVLGLPATVQILAALVAMLPMAVFQIALGLLLGSLLNVKQVGGICGGLLTNLSGWVSGVWFDLALVGGVFQKIAGLLPYVHAVELERSILAGEFTADTAIHLLIVTVYAAVTTVLAVFAFLGQMKKQ